MIGDKAVTLRAWHQWMGGEVWLPSLPLAISCGNGLASGALQSQVALCKMNKSSNNWYFHFDLFFIDYLFFSNKKCKTGCQELQLKPLKKKTPS